jgi:short-subunit dehydrogenase
MVLPAATSSSPATAGGLPWQTAIVVGASSGMGAEIARQLAQNGCRVALLARRAAELNALAGQINANLAPQQEARALVYPHDVTRYDEAPGLFQQICRDLGGLDLLVYAAGVMPTKSPDEWAFAKDRQTIEINVLGAIAWLNEAAQRFAVAQQGTLVGIGSVAGDRGRRDFPVYGASKAALETYLEGVRNRVGRLGVRVVTIKPGPVKTPLTENVGKQPMIIEADEAARQILRAAARGPEVAYVPAKWRPVMFAVRSVPSFLFRKANI